jgi:hypothetical protein
MAFACVCASAGARAEPPPDPARICEQVAATAERDFGLPAGLLTAIGVVESGRWQPALLRTTPWPFAIDAGGDDFTMESADAAIAKVEALRADGSQSIDVGCFQINLAQHPDAFATLAEAFDPDRNARYAARFLVSLKLRTGGWDSAVAAYHSGFAELGEPYRQRVYAAWKGDATTFDPAASDAGLAIWLPSPRAASPSRALIRVIVPSGIGARPDEPGQGARAIVQPVAAGGAIRLSRARLPVVVTPSGRL